MVHPGRFEISADWDRGESLSLDAHPIIAIRNKEKHIITGFFFITASFVRV
jgi:hypothetical protein